MAKVKKIVISKHSNDKWKDIFAGIELYDYQNNSILKAGRID